MIEGLKPLYNGMLRPVLKLFVLLHVRPNHITMAGLALFVAGGYLAAQGHWRGALLAVVAGAFADGWDGMLAREYNQKSRFGGVLDSTVDRLTEIALITGIIWYYLSAPEAAGRWGVLAGVFAITGSLMVSYVKARAEAEGVPCSRGILQRPERIILLCIGLLFGEGYAVRGVPVMVALLWGIAILGYVTMLERIIATARILGKQK